MGQLGVFLISVAPIDATCDRELWKYLAFYPRIDIDNLLWGGLLQTGCDLIWAAFFYLLGVHPQGALSRCHFHRESNEMRH